MLIKLIYFIAVIIFVLAILPYQLDQIDTTKDGEGYYDSFGLKGWCIFGVFILLSLVFILSDPNL